MASLWRLQNCVPIKIIIIVRSALDVVEETVNQLIVHFEAETGSVSARLDQLERSARPGDGHAQEAWRDLRRDVDQLFDLHAKFPGQEWSYALDAKLRQAIADKIMISHEHCVRAINTELVAATEYIRKGIRREMLHRISEVRNDLSVLKTQVRASAVRNDSNRGRPHKPAPGGSQSWCQSLLQDPKWHWQQSCYQGSSSGLIR